jgi:putative NADH-flavin reductase
LARCLIIGCGCRGQMLGRGLLERGHVVRGTTRDPARVPAIERAGIEAVVADPDVVSTLVAAFDHVTVVCILLGSARGSPDRLEALHGSRLEMLLTKLIDTTSRGLVYEAAGTVAPEVLAGGVERVRRFGGRSVAQVETLDADPSDTGAWSVAALEAVEKTL